MIPKISLLIRVVTGVVGPDGHRAQLGHARVGQVAVEVEPLLHHLSDQQRLLRYLLLGHEDAAVGDRAVQVIAHDLVLAAQLSLRQEVNWQ